ncbi:MAG: ABC transporter ATP-binding protein, partial [Rhodospirillaceae bacterium]|nr:ABC transporter ATP-binding protein [Rhodospirillaceae bacterium]
MSNRIAVMYLGRFVEVADAAALFAAPQHPYTRLLLETIPDLGMTKRDREAVAGEVPSPIDPPGGCAFHPRCPHADERCRTERPDLRPLQSDAGGGYAGGRSYRWLPRPP